MGLLIEGRWHDQWYDTKSTGGAFKRQESAFRNWVTADGSSGFKAEPGRYHLYVSLACPWAHRTLIFRRLKKLENAISISVVQPLMLENGWELAPGADPVNGKRFLYEVYTEVNPTISGRVTVPVLWDKQKRTIVSNESAEIIRMLNSEFNEFADASADFYPAELRGEIDEINEYVYPRINNGVYKAGFATSQEVYEQAFDNLFDALDTLDERLGRQRYLVGNRQTEADWRLFTTLVRFDAVYVGHFKCNKRRIADYPNLSNYLRDLYQVDNVRETVNFDHIKRHYYGSHATINPTGIVPKGPALDFEAPHDRDRFRPQERSR
jgi:putative glutathione S-transferase